MPDLEGDTRFLRRLLITVGVLLLVLALWLLLHLVMLVLGAVLLAVLLTALAKPLERWLRLSQNWALALSVLIVILLVGASSWLFGAELSVQIAALLDALPQSWEAVEDWMDRSALGRQIASRLGMELPPLPKFIGDVSRVVLSISSAFTDLFIIVVGGIYIAAQPDLYRRGVLALLPLDRRALGAEVLAAMGTALRRWLVAKLIAMIIIGVLSVAGLTVIGVPSALALGLFAGLAEFVPLVGPVIAAIPALMVALGQSYDMALWTLALYIAVQQLESNVVTPLVQQHAISLPPALTLFAVIAAGLLFGPIGVLFSGPLSVLAFVLFRLLYVREALGDTGTTALPGEGQTRDHAP